MARGKFITFEGGEGSGKSTQAQRLADRLRGLGHDVVVTREPGGSPFAERLRAIILDPDVEPHAPLSEALLFYAARADHLDRVIRPALKAGQWVVCDRFSDSTRVYQGLAGDLDPKIIEALELLVVTPTKPDLTLVIDIPAEVGLGRAALRQTASTGVQPVKGTAGVSGRVVRSLLADRFEARGVDFHRRLRDGFLKIASADPKRCAVVDGQKGADEVTRAIWAAVESRLLSGQS
jgi:dTMP kinase